MNACVPSSERQEETVYNQNLGKFYLFLTISRYRVRPHHDSVLYKMLRLEACKSFAQPPASITCIIQVPLSQTETCEKQGCTVASQYLIRSHSVKQRPVEKKVVLLASHYLMN